MEKVRKLIVLLALCLCMGLLAGCEGFDLGTTQPSTEPTEATEPTEETGGIVGENGTRLRVDYETPGTINPEAVPLDSTTIAISAMLYEMPITMSSLVNNGWVLYDEAMGQQTVAGKTEANVLGFNLYQENVAYLDITSVKNDADGTKPILDCKITRLVFNISGEHAGKLDFVLPGGITGQSTAADVLAVYGDVLENDHFDHVQVGKTMLYYAENVQTGLSFYFGFNEDGTLNGVSISY